MFDGILSNCRYGYDGWRIEISSFYLYKTKKIIIIFNGWFWMKEKILNITLYIEYIIYIIVALILKFVFKQNILFKGWYLIIFIIPILEIISV